MSENESRAISPLSKRSIRWWSDRCGNYLNNRLLQNFVPSMLQTYALKITVSLDYVNTFFLYYFPFVFLKQQPIHLLSFFQHHILSYSLFYLLCSLHSNHLSNHHVISSTISIFSQLYSLPTWPTSTYRRRNSHFQDIF